LTVPPVGSSIVVTGISLTHYRSAADMKHFHDALAIDLLTVPASHDGSVRA